MDTRESTSPPGPGNQPAAPKAMKADLDEIAKNRKEVVEKIKEAKNKQSVVAAIDMLHAATDVEYLKQMQAMPDCINAKACGEEMGVKLVDGLLRDKKEQWLLDCTFGWSVEKQQRMFRELISRCGNVAILIAKINLEE